MCTATGVVLVLAVVLFAVMLSGCIKPTEITIVPDTVILRVGETRDFVATGTFNKYEKDVKNALWSLSNPSVGTLSTEKGTKVTFSATTAGDSTLYAAIGTVEGTAEIEVYVPELTTIVALPEELEFTDGDTYDGFIVVGYDQHDREMDIDPDDIVWSADAQIGTFDGWMFTADLGDATEDVTGTITATLGTLSDTIPVTVRLEPPF